MSHQCNDSILIKSISIKGLFITVLKNGRLDYNLVAYVSIFEAMRLNSTGKLRGFICAHYSVCL